MSFGKHEGRSYREVVQRDPGYSQWCLRPIFVNRGGCSGKDNFARYLIDNTLEVPAPNAGNAVDIGMLAEEHGAIELNKWWDVKNPDGVAFLSHRLNRHTVRSLGGKFFWSVDLGHTNLIDGILLYMTPDYRQNGVEVPS